MAPRRASLLAAALSWLLVASAASGQEDLRRSTDWRVLDAGEFQVHYPGDRFLTRAREVAQWLESARVRLEKELDHKLDGPLSVVLYRSHQEAGQRVEVADNPGGALPIATLVRKRRIVIPCIGSNRATQRTLEFQLAQMFVEQRHYSSSSLKASLLEVKRDLYADWVLLGIAGCSAGPLLPAEEMLVRDAVLDGELPDLSEIHSANSANVHERYQMYVESALAVGWTKGGTPRGSPKRLMHVFDSDVPWPASRLIQRACGISYDDVERRFALAMKERFLPWKGREEAERFARRVRDFDQHYRFYEMCPDPSPDGRKIAFFEDSAGFYDLIVLDRETGDEAHPLRFQLHVSIDSLHVDPRGIDWSPDGRSICFVADRLATTRIYIQPADGGIAKSVELPFDHVLSPQWSPDGRTIAFAALRSGSQDLYLMDVATLEVRPLSTEPWPESEPAWSPDGRFIAFTGETEGQLDLWRIDVETRKLDRVTSTPCDESSPAFRPDGAALTFVSDPGRSLNLFTLEFATGRIARLTDLPGGAFSPSWSRDGREIVFTVYRHGRFTTWAMSPRECPAPADFSDPASALSAAHFTIGPIQEYEVQPYESHVRFESILPTGAALSDIIGFHRFDTGVDYKFRSGGYDLGFEVGYTNRILRPDLFINVGGSTQRDSHGTESKLGGAFGVSYPLDADTRVSLSAFVQEHIRNLDTPTSGDLPPKTFEDGFQLDFLRKNITRRRDNPISGYSFMAQVTWWTPQLASDVDRVNYQAEGRFYVELWHDHVLAVRAAGIHSTGPDRETLSLKDRVRAYDSGDPNGSDVLWATAEFRFPLWRDIDWAMPMQVMLLKDIRGIVFGDVGVISNEENVLNMLAYPVREEWHYSVGVSLQFDTYLVERKYFPIIITLVKALDRTDEAPRGIKFEVSFELAF